MDLMDIIGAEKASALAEALSDPIVISGKTVQQALEEWATVVARKRITDTVNRMQLDNLVGIIDAVESK